MADSIKLVKLTVVENATQAGVVGDKNWAAVKNDSAHVIVEATTAPDNNDAEWKHIDWSGDTGAAVFGKRNRRQFSLASSRKYHVAATLGGVKDHVDVWVLWAVIDIKTHGTRPTNAAPFQAGTRDNSDKLGAVIYEANTSSVIDEKAEVFVVNTGATGKVALIGSLSPKGVGKVVKSSWAFRREIMNQDWLDGNASSSSHAVWTNDTSKPEILRLAPDADDKIYDLDGPNVAFGQKSYETYNNFRQWIEWAGKKCSDHALWHFQARWSLNKDPKKQITLNDVGAKHIVLPGKPYFPPPKSP